MFPTPDKVLPLLIPVALPLREALAKGMAYADDLQPDPMTRDAFFWSHAARWQARTQLLSSESQLEVESWSVRRGVPNCGIHIQFPELHRARLVRSLAGTTPPPGSNKARRAAWQQTLLPMLPIGTLADGEKCPPLYLILDWHVLDGEPVIYVGLPIDEWEFKNRKNPRLHWREPLPDDEADLAGLRFDAESGGDEGVVIELDPAEQASAGDDW